MRAALSSRESFHTELTKLNAEAAKYGSIKTEENGYAHIVAALMPPLWAQRYDKFTSQGRKLGYLD